MSCCENCTCECDRQKNNRSKSLPNRIAEGLADPITPREREQLQEMEQIYFERFGINPSQKYRKK